MAATPNIITRDNFTGQQVPPPNNTAVGWGYWNSMDEAPSAELYGVGPAWIGGVLYWSNGVIYRNLSQDNASNKCVMLFGGDHPHNQYLSGFHKIPLDRGIPWYCAINTSETNTIAAGYPGMLSWSDVATLKSEGVDILSHGAGPHINSWRGVSTGIKVAYTGNGTSALLTVGGTWPAMTLGAVVTGQSDSSVGWTAIDLTNASYNTVAKVVAYINSKTGWTAEADEILTGDEPSNAFLAQTDMQLVKTSTALSSVSGLVTATIANHGYWPGQSITVSGATPSTYNGTFTVVSALSSSQFTYVCTAPTGSASVQGRFQGNRPLCLGGGILFNYSGTAYNRLYIEMSAGALRLMADGVAISALGTGSAPNNTLAGMAASINALGISGLSAYITDDRRTIPPTTSSTFPWMHGEELSINLERSNALDITTGYVRLNAGLSGQYIVDRLIAKSIEAAAANGVDIKHFAQSGLQFDSDLVTNAAVEHRGNPQFINIFPNAVPIALLPAQWHPHVEPNSGYGFSSVAHAQALIDAANDSPGFLLDILTHSIDPDGSSGYTLPYPNNTVDMPEATFVAMLDRVKSSPNIVATSVDDLGFIRGSSQKPSNFLFNPRFKNSGESLLGLDGLNASQRIVPGISVVTPAQVTAASINNGKFRIATNSASSFKWLSWHTLIERGVVYEASIDIVFYGYTSGNVTMSAYPIRGMYYNIYGGGANQPISSDSQSRSGRIRMLMQYDMYGSSTPEVRSKPATATFNVPAGTSKIRFGTGAYITGINLAGATPSATTPTEVATAINAAIAAAITAGTYTHQYAGAATVDNNGRVVISAPHTAQSSTSGTVTIATDTGSDQITPIFGGTYIIGAGFHYPKATTEVFPLWLSIVPACIGDFEVSNPRLIEYKRI